MTLQEPFDVDSFLDGVERDIEVKSEPTIPEFKAAIIEASKEVAAYERGLTLGRKAYREDDPENPRVRYDTLVARFRKRVG